MWNTQVLILGLLLLFHFDCSGLTLQDCNGIPNWKQWNAFTLVAGAVLGQAQCNFQVYFVNSLPIQFIIL